MLEVELLTDIAENLKRYELKDIREQMDETDIENFVNSICTLQVISDYLVKGKP